MGDQLATAHGTPINLLEEAWLRMAALVQSLETCIELA